MRKHYVLSGLAAAALVVFMTLLFLDHPRWYEVVGVAGITALLAMGHAASRASQA